MGSSQGPPRPGESCVFRRREQRLRRRRAHRAELCSSASWFMKTRPIYRTRPAAYGGGMHRSRSHVMSRPKILVTGATGRTGAVVVSELLNAGYPVRAMVRREDERSGALRARGVEIAVA